jgi:hypothetical protein
MHAARSWSSPTQAGADGTSPTHARASSPSRRGNALVLLLQDERDGLRGLQVSDRSAAHRDEPVACLDLPALRSREARREGLDGQAAGSGAALALREKEPEPAARRPRLLPATCLALHILLPRLFK